MRLSRADLLQALEAVKGAIADKNFVPILTHVLIDKDAVLGYDSEVGVRVKLPKSCEGTFNVKFSTFLELVKALEEEDIDVTVEGKKVHLKCGKHRSTLTQLEEEFPRPSVKGLSAWNEVPAGFKEAMERCLLAVSKNENDKALCAVLLKGSHAYSTNRTSLVRCKLDGLNVAPVLLPTKAVEELIRLGNPKRMATAGAFAVFDYLNLTFIARTREGAAEFPPMDKILEGCSSKIPVPDGLAQALARLNIFASQHDSPCASITVDALGVSLVVRGDSATATESLEVDPSLVTAKGFNPEKLLPALQYAEAMDFGKNATAPLYLKGEVAGFEFCLAPTWEN